MSQKTLDPPDESEQETLLEQYKTYLDTIQHFDEQRLHVHEFFMTINSFLGTLFGAIGGYLFASEKGHVLLLLPLAIVGFSFSYVWYLWVTNYTTVNKAKWDVIYDMEKKLPYQPFQSEWDGKGNLKRNMTNPPNYFSWIWAPKKDAYYSVSGINSLLPQLFGWMYIALVVIPTVYLKFNDIIQFWENVRNFGLGWIGVVILIVVLAIIILVAIPFNKRKKSANDSSAS